MKKQLKTTRKTVFMGIDRVYVLLQMVNKGLRNAQENGNWYKQMFPFDSSCCFPSDPLCCCFIALSAKPHCIMEKRFHNKTKKNVCVCVYIYIYMCIYIYIYVHTHIYIYISHNIL